MSDDQMLKEVLERRRQWGKTRDSDFDWLVERAEKAERYEAFIELSRITWKLGDMK